MPFADLDEHLAEVFGEPAHAWPEQVQAATELHDQRKARNRELAALSRWRKGGGTAPVQARGLPIRDGAQVALTRSKVPPGRWTKVREGWVRAL